MNLLRIKSAIILATISITTSSWAANPCMPIAQACMQAGYYKGGSGVGKGLVEDCVKPIVAKSKTLPNTAFTDDALQQCAATIAAKNQSQSAPQ